MKKERKEELQTNDLAKTLSDLKRYSSEYGNHIIGGVIAFLVIVLIVVYMRNEQSSKYSTAWNEIQDTEFYGEDGGLLPKEDIDGSMNRLNRIASENRGTWLSAMALSRISQVSFFLSLEDVSEEGAAYLDHAEKALQQLSKEYGSKSPVFSGRALMNLVAIEQYRFVLDNDQSHKEKAKGYLQEVVDNAQKYKGTPYPMMATAMMNDLDRVFHQVVLVQAPEEETPALPVPTPTPTVTEPAPEKSQAEESESVTPEPVTTNS